MKVNRFFTEITQDPWMISDHSALGYLPVIAAWLNREEISFEDRDPISIGLHNLQTGDFIQSLTPGFISPGLALELEDSDFPEETIAIVSLRGPITKYDGMCHYGALSYANLVQRLARVENVVGLVLDIDGPGGAVNAIPPLIQALQTFRKEKPIGVHADCIASAHYCISLFSNFIYLDNTLSACAGSIGVLQTIHDYSKYFEEKGISIRNVYAPQSEHKNSPWEKAMKGDDTELKELVLAPLAQKFQDYVKAERGERLRADIDGVITGGLFYGQQAVEYGLADGIGTLGDCVRKVGELVNDKYVKKFMSI